MTARGITRSQRGAQSEAKRRITERMAAAEVALGTYLEAARRQHDLLTQSAEAEREQDKALRELVNVVGKDQAAVLANVDVGRIKAATSRKQGEPAHGRLATQAPSVP